MLHRPCGAIVRFGPGSSGWQLVQQRASLPVGISHLLRTQRALRRYWLPPGEGGSLALCSTPHPQLKLQFCLPSPEGEHDVVLLHLPTRPALPVLRCQRQEGIEDGADPAIFGHSLLNLGGARWRAPSSIGAAQSIRTTMA
jgi:hypothetical protein